MPQSNETTRPGRAEQTRSRLLAAAVDAFSARGFHGTSTRDLAAAAGMSPAAVYVHYRSKEELLFELALTGHREVLALVRTVDDPAAPPAARLHAVMWAFARHHAVGHVGARVVNYELAALDGAHRAQIRELRRQINETVRGLVDAGVAAGAFRTDDPRTATLALLSMGIDIARWYHDDGDLSPDQIADFYAGLALRTVDAIDPAPVSRDTPGSSREQSAAADRLTE